MAAEAAKDENSLRGLRDAAIIWVMSDTMLRVSEAASLRVQDVISREDGSGRLKIRQSKTDPDGNGRTLYLGPPALRHFCFWLAAADIQEGPAFRRIRRGGHVGAGGLSANAVRLIVKERAAAAGIGGGKVSGQSLRIGMAQTLAAAGASLVEMQLAGRWRSPQMPAHYASGERAGRSVVARLIYAEGEPSRQKAETDGSAASLERHILALAEKFHAVGTRSGTQAAEALRTAVEAVRDRRVGGEELHVARCVRTESKCGGPSEDAACSLNQLLTALSDLAETWRLEREV